jgi:predicted secreted protein
MAWYSVLAIYLLFWVLTLFVVLPYGVRTARELGKEEVPGQAPSAPHSFSLARTLMWTTLVSAVAFGLFLMNWNQGWITRADLEAITPQPGRSLPQVEGEGASAGG